MTWVGLNIRQRALLAAWKQAVVELPAAVNGLDGIICRKEGMNTLSSSVVAGLLMAMLSATGAACKKEPVAAAPDAQRDAKRGQSRQIAEATQKLVAARVNGVDVSMRELIREMNLVSRVSTDLNEQTFPASTKKIRKKALDNLIFRELVLQEAARQGITAGQNEVEEVFRQLRKQLGSEEEYRRYLDLKEITEADLRKRIERGRCFELMTAREIYQKVKIDEREMRAEYGKNKSAYLNASRQLSYEEAAGLIRRTLTLRTAAEKMKEWGRNLRRNAKIVIARNDGE